MQKIFLFLIIVLFGCDCQENPVSQDIQDGHLLYGKVIGITDGDTLTILDKHNDEHRIRLGEIDAPEYSQEFGKESKKALEELTLNKDVKVFWKKKDRFAWKTRDNKVQNGRIIGGVYVEDHFINREMVEMGMAWHYKQFSKDETLELAEKYAKENKYGLWEKENPTPPWQYRKH